MTHREIHIGSDMARTSTYHLHDRVLGGQLGALLLQWRSEGKTVQDIAFILRSEHDLKVSVSTVHRWVAIAEAESAEAAS